jgi:hypothetical protein
MPKKGKVSQRTKESEAAALILRAILEANPPVPGVSTRDKREALELAISLLDYRALDAQED